MNYLFSSIIILILSSFSFGQGLPETLEKKDFSIGNTLKIKSNILGEERDLNIYLPLGYSVDSSKLYPVIYLLDGSADEDFIHISGLVQFASFSWTNMLPESIVVGIGNVDRKRDFTYPATNEADRKDFPTSGHSANFISFLEKEVQPYIEANYQTNNNRTLIGQSLGGLLATEILFYHPQLFDNYIIVSPSLWWDNESLLSQTPLPSYRKKSIYIAVGKEGDIMERTAKALYEKINDGTTDTKHIFFEFLSDKTHADALHQAVYNAFNILFNPNNE